MLKYSLSAKINFNMKADFHIHTRFSDGKDTLEEIIQRLVKKAPSTNFCLGITDHHFLSLSEVKKLDHFLIIPGIEISANLNKDHACHLVGYSFSPRGVLSLEKFLLKIRNGYQQRARKIYKKLINLGFSLGEFKELRAQTLPKPVYTYDFAAKLKQLLNFPDEERVIKWAKDNGNLLYVEEKNFLPPATEVITILHRSNFKVFWAHPGTRFLREGNNDESLFESFIHVLKANGLDGIEVFSPLHNPWQIEKFQFYAQKLKLVISGGSDYHGKGRRTENFYFGLPEYLLKNFLRYLKYDQS